MTEQTDLTEVVAEWIDDFDGVAPINKRKQLLSARSLLAKLAEAGVVIKSKDQTYHDEVFMHSANSRVKNEFYRVQPLLPEDKP